MELDWTEKTASITTLTVAMALELVTEHNAVNRHLSPATVDRYARDMTAQAWRFTGDPITVDRNGQIVNGQHRCYAVVKSGIPIDVVLVTGVDPTVRPYVDAHRKRSVADALQMSGIESVAESVFGRNTVAGMWNAFYRGLRKIGGISPTNAELLEFVSRHREAGEFALQAFRAHGGRVPGVTTAPVIATVARASYHYPHDRLERFVEVLYSGIPSDRAEQIIAKHSRWLITSRGLNSNAAQDIYGRTARVLDAYMRGEELGRIVVPRKEPYPLPEASDHGAVYRIHA